MTKRMVPNVPILPLTALRFFAAMLVVIFHYNLATPLFPSWIAQFGYPAVTFFFILSGFILTYSHIVDGSVRLAAREFLAARVARIAPAYLVALVLIAPFFFRHLTTQDLIAAPFVLTMLQAWVPGFALAWNPPAWSLSNELFFYAIFPLLFLRPISIRTLLAISIALLLLTSLIAHLVAPWSPEWHHFAAYFPLMNLPQFLLGVALGRMYVSRDPRRASRDTLLLAGITVVLIVMSMSSVRVLVLPVFLALPFALVVWGAAVAAGPLAKVLSWPTLVLLGEASYSLYILHVPVWYWWNHVTRVLEIFQLPGWLDFLAYCGLSIGLSIACFKVIEGPGRRWVLARLRSRIA